MNCKAKFNYWVDLLFLITLLVVIFTGLLLWGWIRPQGAPGGPGAPAAAAAQQSANPALGERGGDAARPDPGKAAGGAPQMGEAKIFWGLLRGKAFWGMNKKQWENVHAWVSVAMCVFFICHLVMHFRWLVSPPRRTSAARPETVKPNMKE
ncbi:MAG: DUF4405 domain-containing protein [Thermoguttaceae bacterium]|nr:DUF4405 domain-containing protein [Thermoguttaceae bacterium]